jgi:hypothetical protein
MFWSAVADPKRAFEVSKARFRKKNGCLVKYCESAFEVPKAKNYVWNEDGK